MSADDPFKVKAPSGGAPEADEGAESVFHLLSEVEALRKTVYGDEKPGWEGLQAKVKRPEQGWRLKVFAPVSLNPRRPYPIECNS